MSKRADKGYYFMWRGWMKNRVFEREPVYDRRSAWAWLIEKAAWEDHQTAWNGKLINIKRGQVPHSFRKMAEAWGWNLSKVQRYIDALKTDTMIDTHTDTGFCIITICNYDEYQFNESWSDTAADTRPDTPPDTPPDTNNRNKKLKKENNNPPTPQGGEQGELLAKGKKPSRRTGRKPTTAELAAFELWWKQYPRKEGKDEALKAYLGLLDEGVPAADLLRAVKGMAKRFDADTRPKADKMRFCKYPQGWLNGGRWKDYLTGDLDDEDDDEMPKNMTPEEHAKWCAERLGLWRIQ